MRVRFATCSTPSRSSGTFRPQALHPTPHKTRGGDHGLHRGRRRARCTSSRSARRPCTQGNAFESRTPDPGSRNFRIHLPIRVSIDSGDVGGPSAGLAFALDVLEKLGRDVDRGHKIAATGEIFLNGSIGPIGGIKQKTIGARKAGVDAFLVPAGENSRDAHKYAHGLRIIPVKSFQQALHALATLPTTA